MVECTLLPVALATACLQTFTTDGSTRAFRLASGTWYISNATLPLLDHCTVWDYNASSMHLQVSKSNTMFRSWRCEGLELNRRCFGTGLSFRDHRCITKHGEYRKKALKDSLGPYKAC